MKFISTFAAALLVFVIYQANAAMGITINSPHQIVQLKVMNEADGSVWYSVSRKDKAVILPSTFSFTLKKPDVLLHQFNITSIDSSSVNETWQPVWGELKNIQNNYKQLVLTLTDKNNSGIILKIVFRVFDDGAAFRYEFPQQKKLNYFIIADELTQFKLTGDHKTFWIPGDYDSNEYLYNTTKLTDVDALKAVKEEPAIGTQVPFSANAVQTPLMMKSNDGLYINIHEAALVNYPGIQIDIDKKNLTLTSHLVPDAVGNKAYLHAPAVTPWRTIIVSDKATDILASKMILNLNEPSKIKDISFVKPQKFVGVWWEMFNGKSAWDSASGHHGATTANVKKYIDFAAKHGIDGVLVEGWNRGWEDWYGQWKENVFDFITPYGDFNIDELTAYAKAKNVRIVAHHETSGAATNYERYMDTAYRFMINHHQNTVKTGYVGLIIPRGEHHDGQWMVNHYIRVAEKTAAYQIMLDAHEPVRPTGLYRTYPNWMACEAGRGTEFNGFSRGNAPEHETIMPFTRWMGGPMDYTPGIFHMKLTQYDPNKKEMLHTTLAKQLAFYVVIFSPIQMAADMPENYEAHLDAFKFIEDVAVDWDDTKIVEAEPGDYVTIARKAKGTDNWFVGGITDENARTSTLDFSFLDNNKKYEATIYRDAEDAHYDSNPEAYVIEKKIVDNKTVLKLKEAAGGGYAISLKKL
jgi:hypothetical protein